MTAPTVDRSTSTPITIGNSAEVGHDFTINNVSITSEIDPYDTSARDYHNIRSLCSELKSALKTRRFTLIFVDTHTWDKIDLDILEQRLWTGALAELVNHGLLVIDIFDPYLMEERSSFWPPDPSQVLQLPEQFTGTAYAHAEEDLIAIALEASWSKTAEEARGYAKGLLETSSSIQDVYARLGLAVARKGVSSASPR
ncbi:hypothetical protein [Amycolatopsis solani]|uniref:hypothetical protein n=1 Tax=Amycolatopsis solani TaxID=3028615 RepID=UPI0025B21FE1|nr:hypothetical protein [Amycolatopsis sp. MEP2-6]